ncbi:MAG: hypothetical protein CMM99_04880 [Rickettsiales bacterium]|nr:hypothetical protein [Rickettsiales bacterium]
MFNKFFKLQKYLNVPKKFIFYLILITILSSILEILGLSTLYAFLNNIQSNEISNDSLVLKHINNYSKQNTMIIITIVFCLIFILKNLLIIFFNFFTFNNLEKIKNKTYHNYFIKVLNSNYLDIIKDGHIKHSQIFSRYLDHAFNGYITSYIKITADTITVVFVVCFIFYVNFFISSLAILYLGIIAFIIINTQGKKLKINSQEISISEEKTKQYLFEIIKNFKEIYAYKIQNMTIDQFNLNIRKYFKSEKKYLLIQSNLKSFYEISIILLISIIFFYLLNINMLENSIAMLGIFGFAIAKLIPYINSITSNFNTLKQVSYCVNEIKKFYESPEFNLTTIKNKKIEDTFSKLSDHKLSSLKIKELSFQYDNSSLIIKNYNDEIKIGTMNCIVGPSGSGKTTLVDLIMGLIKPESGSINFLNSNNEVMQKYSDFAYISQSPCIFKGSLAKNITFKDSLDENDKDKLLKIINSLTLFNSLSKDEIFSKDIYLEGQNISGGQKQKICIARALYNDSEILFVDEGTSNLDRQSEKEVYQMLKANKLNKIIFFITHKILDKGYFDKIIDMSKI